MRKLNKEEIPFVLGGIIPATFGYKNWNPLYPTAFYGLTALSFVVYAHAVIYETPLPQSILIGLAIGGFAVVEATLEYKLGHFIAEKVREHSENRAKN
ncbi:MAG: hypothetical protein ACHQJ6_04165 [Candidatus Berkiellales bacterium]